MTARCTAEIARTPEAHRGEVTNAVYDAVGIRMNHLPLTPERVYWGLKNKNGDQCRSGIGRRALYATANRK